MRRADPKIPHHGPCHPCAVNDVDDLERCMAFECASMAIAVLLVAVVVGPVLLTWASAVRCRAWCARGALQWAL